MLPNLVYLGYRATVAKQTYPDGSLRLQLFTDTGELLATASVCLADYGFKPPVNCCYLKTYAENQSLLEVLVEAGIVEPTGEVVRFGPYKLEAPLVKVL